MRARITTLGLVLLGATVMTNPSFADTTAAVTSTMVSRSSETLSTSNKAAFAREKTLFYHSLPEEQQNTIPGMTSALGDTMHPVDQLIMNAAFSKDGEKERYLHELEAMGVYRYPMEERGDASMMSDDTSVVVDVPDIYYSVQEDVWVVATSGHWRDDSWKEDLGKGEVNVGFPDAFGVGYANVSGSYTTHVVRQVGVLRNGLSGSAETSKITYNRSDGNGANGFSFQLQDYVEYNKYGTASGYVGKEWFGACTYDGSFADYGGIATGFYIHTWARALISSINLNAPIGGAGIAATIETVPSTGQTLPVSLRQTIFIAISVLILLAGLYMKRKIAAKQYHE